MLEEIITETPEKAPEKAADRQTDQKPARPDTAPEAKTQPPAEPDAPPQESGPVHPRVERGGSLMGRGPSSLSPPDWSSADDETSMASADQDPPSETEDFEPGELVLISNDMPGAVAMARELAAYRLRIKSRQALKRLGLVVSVFRLPPDAGTLALLAKIRRQSPNMNLDVNQRYRLMGGPRQRYGQDMIGLSTGNTSCLDNARVGLIDTAVSLVHPALAGRSIDLAEFAGPTPAPTDHGTAIASLWVGDPDQGFTPLMREAALSVAAVFRQRGNTIDTTTDTLALGLDWLLGQEVEAINLSLGGRKNRVLDLLLQQLLAKEILLVAAAGNLGSEGPAVYPAAHPGVIAVTAVDANQRRYQRANRGEHLDFAAPGVHVWAASADGTYYHSGTSYAAPFVLATLLAEKHLSSRWQQQAQLGAIDLGIPGKDDNFGWGLIQWPDACTGQ
ncbi:MAG: S8 family serine peptidase [Halomonas sp.]|nr:S8 family serine peptidase [Halomonas sp.]